MIPWLGEQNPDLPTCGFTINSSPGLLFQFSDPSVFNVSFQTCINRNFDTVLAVFEDSDCDGDLECLDGADDRGNCGLGTVINITGACSTQYFLYVTGFGSAGGDFQLDAYCNIE